MSDPQPDPIDTSVKALVREFPDVVLRLAGVEPPPGPLRFEDTAINLPERRADHVLVIGAAGEPEYGAIYLEYVLRPDTKMLPTWEYKRAALRLRLGTRVVLLVLYLEAGGRATFPETDREEVAGIANEFQFAALRLRDHADRIRRGELWELAPLLVLCEDNPDERTVRTQLELIRGSGAPAGVQADLLAMALRVDARDLPRAMLEAVFRETIPMIQGASSIDDWIAEGKAECKAEGKAEGKAEEARLLLSALLRALFGDLPAEMEQRIDTADPAWCETLLLAASRAESYQDLRW